MERICLIMANKNPEEIFRQYGGQLRMSEAIKHGITRYMLYSLKDNGIIEQISRGVYRLTSLPPLSNQDLVTVSLRIPNAVICLISALSYHELTTQIPHSVSIAIPRETHTPSLAYPPIQVHRFSGQAYLAGIEEHLIDEANIKIYSAEKTIADCFKYRNKIGMDIVLEAIKFYRARKQFNMNEILKFARICRVDKVIAPYLEVMI